jgi:CDP-diacylglycerol--serine O-phosphatidyltransferase
VIISAVLVVAFIPGMTRFVFVPLVLYALWGLKKNVNTAIVSRIRKHRRHVRHEEQTINSDVS